MDRRPSDRKKHQLPSAKRTPYVESYDEAVNLYFSRDLQAWEKLRTFHERFLRRAWEHPLPDKDGNTESAD
jgi:hypothetical protein